MSIFSRLLKRSPEDGGGAAADPASPPAKERTDPLQAQKDQKDQKDPKEPPKESQQPPDQQGGKARPNGARPVNGVAHGSPPPPPTAGATADAKADAKAQAKIESKLDSKGGHVNGSAGKTLAYMAVPKPAPIPAPGMVPPPATPRGASAAAAARPARGARGPGHEAGVDDDGAQPMDMMPVLAASSVEQAIEKALSARGTASAPPAVNGEGTTTASDRAAMMATFEDLAVAHTAQVRSLMLEVRWGEAQATWIELGRPALRSLRSMANQLGSAALTAALDGFDSALEKALAPGAPPVVSGAVRDTLLAAYGPLTACLPRAFDLEGERDRREPLVVRALLGQVQGLDPLMIDRMTAAGLGRLETLVHARADEIAAVAGVAPDVAAAAAARVQAFRRATQASLATLDPAATTRELGTLFQALASEHRAFEDAAAGWSDRSPALKRQLRRQRDVSFLQITIALARLGEIDLALRLEKLPFARRIEELERFLARVLPAALVSAAERDADKKADARSEGGLQPGAHAAP